MNEYIIKFNGKILNKFMTIKASNLYRDNFANTINFKDENNHDIAIFDRHKIEYVKLKQTELE